MQPAGSSLPAASTLSIGELAARAGVRTSAIRYYESVGLLPEAPRVSGNRRYAPATAQLIAALHEGMRRGCLRVEDCVIEGDAGCRLPGPAASAPTVALGRAPRRDGAGGTP